MQESRRPGRWHLLRSGSTLKAETETFANRTGVMSNQGDSAPSLRKQAWWGCCELLKGGGDEGPGAEFWTYSVWGLGVGKMKVMRPRLGRSGTEGSQEKYRSGGQGRVAGGEPRMALGHRTGTASVGDWRRNHS